MSYDDFKNWFRDLKKGKLVAILFVVAFLVSVLIYNRISPSSSPSIKQETESGCNQSVNDNRGSVYQNCEVNKPATYRWVNQASFNSEGEIIGKPGDKDKRLIAFRTKLLFEADNDNFPKQVCLGGNKIEIGIIYGIYFQGQILMDGCLQSPTKTVSVSILSQNKPTIRTLAPSLVFSSNEAWPIKDVLLGS